MNDFKYQEKQKNSDKAMNAFKDFDKVLSKHKAIHSSYSKMWKIAIAATTTFGVLAGLFYFNKKEPQVIENKTISRINDNYFKNPKDENNVFLTVSQNTKREDKVDATKKTEPTQKEKNKKEKNKKFETQSVISQDLLKDYKKTSIQNNKNLIEQSEKKIETAWFKTNEVATSERTKIPTLYISKIAWPEKLTKTELTRFPKINAIYKAVAREIPIVDGIAYITKRDSKEKPKGYKINGNNFPPSLIRALHKAEDNSILLFKDITLFIPGKGRENIGDKIIEIDFNKKYKDQARANLLNE